MNVTQLNSHGRLRHLITLADLDRAMIEQILERASRFRVPTDAPPRRDTSLRGQTVANLFFEASTRTRASFELAARRLDADVLNLDVNMSSRAKGESIMDTNFTLQAMQVDIFVVRDASTGVPARIASHVADHVCVLNAGESEISHPTQGLLDLMTVLRHKPRLSEIAVAIIGDIRHSRVARSAYEAFTKFGVGELRFVGPAELQPEPDQLPLARRELDIGAGVKHADVVMTLRVQRERFAQLEDIPDPQQYFRRYGLTQQCLALAKPDAIVMHPGPMNRGVEIEGAVADGPQSVIQEQVTNGLAVRMAVLAMVNRHVIETRGSAE
ncbi:MAG TPA: aspartate carbamoyltransferase catalytic subunit [Gammaproteobacteria bacterium]|nr:aspartate carbamoyltransferase catalytic subunit [Gammaproteobacteria bacterium]